jgi:hypothetical protein
MIQHLFYVVAYLCSFFTMSGTAQNCLILELEYWTKKLATQEGKG